MLPREWARKSQTPVWKAAAIAGWVLSLILAQCLVMVLAWPGLVRPAPPPPPEAPVAAIPSLPSVGRSREEMEVSNSMARIRCLLNVGRSQEALSETIACLTQCQRAQLEPPAQLSVLFAQTVASLSSRTETSSPNLPKRPQPQTRLPVASAAVTTEPMVAPVCGRVPGPSYPQAHLKSPVLAQLPPPGPPPMLPPAPAQQQSTPYPFQPGPGGPRPGGFPGGFPPPPPGYESESNSPQVNW